MTASVDSPTAPPPTAPPAPAPAGPLWGARERVEWEAIQESVLPDGRVTISCAAPFGAGGLGRHTQELVDALGRRGQDVTCICASNIHEHAVASRGPARQAKLASTLAPLARLSPGWRVWTGRVAFDAGAAARLPPADHLLAFNRQALTQFRTARRSGYESVALVSGSPHVLRVARQHALAYRSHPLERSFGTQVRGRYLREYQQADRIYVASRYTWESFSEHGIAEEKLALFPLIPHPRYRPPAARRQRGTFDVVYAGSLTVAKGVALLIDAFRRLPHADMQLVLVGGWKSRAMSRFVHEACAADPRILVCPGDPLPHLLAARLCVHPTYEDGFAYAPAEALACGVPVLVSEDTGMRDLIQPGRTGEILPTGDRDALAEAIDAVYRGELLA